MKKFYLLKINLLSFFIVLFLCNTPAQNKKTANEINNDNIAVNKAAGNSPQKILSGETVNLNIITLPAGEDIIITFEVKVDTPFPGSVTEVKTQGTISGSNFSSVLTDDPDVGGPTDSTVTPVNPEALPVELLSFAASAFENRILLSWNTATEINNYGFDIERKFELNNSWQKISFAAGSGNSNSPKEYSYTDMTASIPGRYSYRLKQIDIDGKFKYSDEISVEVSKPETYTLLQNFPNPFNPSTKISYAVKDAGDVRIIIYNALGEVVENLLDEFKEPGTYLLNFDASGLPSGIYFYRIQVNNYSEIKKMVLLK